LSRRKHSGSALAFLILLGFLLYLIEEHLWVVIVILVALAIYLVIWLLAIAPEKQRKRQLAEWWLSQTGTSLEEETASLYSSLGYRVERKGGTGDEGVDLILRWDDKRIIVQCKAHAKPIGPKVVRELYGTLVHHKAHRAILVSPSGFTQKAAEFADGKPIELLDAFSLVELSHGAGRSVWQEDA